MPEDKLLLDEYPLIILPKLAVIIGLNEAIVLQQIHYWLKHYERAEQNEEKKPHFRDGRWWIYNTVEEWTAQFPFWSYDTVKRALASLRASYTPGDKTSRVAREPLLTTTSEYNRAGFDNTLWYTIDYDEVEGLPQRIGQNAPTDSANCPNGEGILPQRMGQDAPVEESNLPHAIPETTRDNPRDHPETTANNRPDVAAVGSDDLKNALAVVGIKGKKKQQILELEDPPDVWDVYGWAYYAYAQEWAANPCGVVIDYLLDPDARHHPPEPFKQFGVEHLGPVIAARALAEAYHNQGYGDMPVESRVGPHYQQEWRKYFGRYMPAELPLPNPAAAMWPAESSVLQAGLDAELVGPEVCSHWEHAWQDFLSCRTPLTREAWSQAGVITAPLGYSRGVLAVHVSDLVVRSTIEEHRAEFEAVVGTRIQFTALNLSLPTADEQAPGVGEQKTPAGDSSVWAAALGQLQLQMTQATYDTWLRDSRLVQQEDNLFTVGVKSSYAKDWLEHRLIDVIKRTLARLTGHSVEVRFVVLTEGDPRIQNSHFTSRRSPA